MPTVEFIPANWSKRAAWAAACGEKLLCLSRPATIERRSQTRRTSDAWNDCSNPSSWHKSCNNGKTH